MNLWIKYSHFHVIHPWATLLGVVKVYKLSVTGSGNLLTWSLWWIILASACGFCWFICKVEENPLFLFQLLATGIKHTVWVCSVWGCQMVSINLNKPQLLGFHINFLNRKKGHEESRWVHNCFLQLSGSTVKSKQGPNEWEGIKGQGNQETPGIHFGDWGLQPTGPSVYRTHIVISESHTHRLLLHYWNMFTHLLLLKDSTTVGEIVMGNITLKQNKKPYLGWGIVSFSAQKIQCRERIIFICVLLFEDSNTSKSYFKSHFHTLTDFVSFF